MRTARAIACLLAWCLALQAAKVGATPSTVIWIPSADIQKFAIPHVNFDAYVPFRSEPDGTRKPPAVFLGPTIGVLPFEKLQAEVGFDLAFVGNPALDQYPLYLNAKLATPEDALASWSPALAVGLYNAGLKGGVTNQNVGYVLAGRTLPLIGRLSAGYYLGNGAVLRDAQRTPSRDGLLASWDRTICEISDKLWLAVDYQGGNSLLGALNAGAAWRFAPNVGVVLGYDHFYGGAVAGRDTFTVQVDLDVQ